MVLGPLLHQNEPDGSILINHTELFHLNSLQISPFLWNKYETSVHEHIYNEKLIFVLQRVSDDQLPVGITQLSFQMCAN